MEAGLYLASKNRRKGRFLRKNSRCYSSLIVNKFQMDGATFCWVFAFLAHLEKRLKLKIATNFMQR